MVGVLPGRVGVVTAALIILYGAAVAFIVIGAGLDAVEHADICSRLGNRNAINSDIIGVAVVAADLRCSSRAAVKCYGSFTVSFVCDPRISADLCSVNGHNGIAVPVGLQRTVEVYVVGMRILRGYCAACSRSIDLDRLICQVISRGKRNISAENPGRERILVVCWGGSCQLGSDICTRLNS